MLYKARRGQVSYGQAIGIVLMDTFTPFIPGDVGNASTYPFPVRFHTVPRLTSERVLAHDMSCIDGVIQAAKTLERDGVKAITGDCGFMAIYHKQVANEVTVPVFLSSLLQVPFLSSMLSPVHKVGIITADASSLDSSVLKAVGIHKDIPITIRGLEHCESFRRSMLKEEGILDSEKIEIEVVTTAQKMVEEDPAVKIILLECSDLPPYGAAVQEVVGLPVFDFITMIHFVYMGLVKRRFTGFM